MPVPSGGSRVPSSAGGSRGMAGAPSGPYGAGAGEANGHLGYSGMTATPYAAPLPPPGAQRRAWTGESLRNPAVEAPAYAAPDHLGARDRAARRFAVRPSAGIAEAPVGEIGRVIYSIVQEQPGIHFRGLARAANLTSAGQLRHHLDRLERHGLVVELEDGRYKRFFAAGDHEAELRPGLARFSRLVPRRIGKLLLSGPMNRTELRRSLGCADSTLGYHLNRMLRSGDLQKQRTPTGCNYALADEAFVRRLLQSPDGRPMPGPGGALDDEQAFEEDALGSGWPPAHHEEVGIAATRPPRPTPGGAHGVHAGPTSPPASSWAPRAAAASQPSQAPGLAPTTATPSPSPAATSPPSPAPASPPSPAAASPPTPSASPGASPAASPATTPASEASPQVRREGSGNPATSGSGADDAA